MYYYMTEYSFDSDRPVQGPFSSYEECWNAMEKDAENELRIDTKENEYESTIEKSADEGTIVITNIFPGFNDDVTTWSIIDVPMKMLPSKKDEVKQLLTTNGVSADKSQQVLEQVESILKG